MQVAFVGLGVMGYPMAGYLRKAGHEVCVYNRTASKAEQWCAEFGGTSADTPAGAAANAEIVFCCVGNDEMSGKSFSRMTACLRASTARYADRRSHDCICSWLPKRLQLRLPPETSAFLMRHCLADRRALKMVS